MDFENIDFEGSANQGTNSQQTNPTSNKEEDVSHLNGSDKDDITGKSNESEEGQQPSEESIPSTGELNPGDQLEIDGKNYKVADNGDIVDDKGNVFIAQKDVKNWLESVNVSDNENSNEELTIDSIQEALGITITDGEGKPVTFANNAEGVSSYVDSVIQLKSRELQEAAINKLYSENPLLKQFNDYVKLTGTARGFGDIPDRSGIRLDKDNDAQLVAVIKMAAKEFGNKSLNDNYIRYLKESGALYDEARHQLEALVEKDEAYKKDLERRAEEQRIQEAEEIKNYWNGVNKLIASRVIGGYKIPETFTKEVDGKKYTMTPGDFFTYVSKPIHQNENGSMMTQYQVDLAKLSDEDYLNREMIDAWLMFTGGTYKDLIDMAVKEEKVRQFKIKSKENRNSKSVRITRGNNNGKANYDDIILY